MIKIKKVLIAIFIVLAFFVEEAVCASLRVPMSFSGSSQDKERIIGLIVAKRIQALQATGIKPGTINGKIKQEFDKTEYRLQELVRMGDNGSFYVRLGSEYLEIANTEVRNIDRAAFEQGRRILVKVINKSYSREELVVEVKKVTAKLQKKLKRPPNIRETAEAMPSLQTSRNPAALLYKHFQANKISPYDYGISRFSGKANLVIKKSAATEGMSFAFASTRIFLPTQLSGRIEISAAKTPISKEKKIGLVDRKSSKNRLTIEYIPEQDTLRLIYTRPSEEEVVSDIKGVKGKTSITLTLNPVFSDFYDTVFSIPLYQGKERLKAVAKHLRNNRFGTSFEQQERYINFHGHLYLPSFYETNPSEIKVFRDRESWARFLVLEDIANPDNMVGYEWREDRIIPLEQDIGLEVDSSVSMDGKEMPLYYLHRSNVFRAFDQRLDKSVETIIATPNDARLSAIAIGTAKFSFRVKRAVSVISFGGQRSKQSITRDDRERYPIKIIRSDDKREIKIGYRDPDVQGEFVIEGLNWEDGSPVVLKGPSGYEGKRGYFNISTIIEMLKQNLLPGIEASNWMMETFDFSEGASNLSLRNPIRSYKIERTESGEKFLVEDVLVDPKGFLPWEDQRASELSTDNSLASNSLLQKEGLALLDIGTHSGEFLRNVARMNDKAGKLVGIDRVAQDAIYSGGSVSIETRSVDTQAGNWQKYVERELYDVVTINYLDVSNLPDLISLLGVAKYALKPEGLLYIATDSEDHAKELRDKIGVIGRLFADVQVLPLPEDWPLSEHTMTTGFRENHRLIMANPAMRDQAVVPIGPLKVFNGFEEFVNFRTASDLFEKLGPGFDIKRDERFRHVILLLLAAKKDLKIPDEPSKAMSSYYRYPTNCGPCSVRARNILQSRGLKAKMRTIKFPKENFPELAIDRHSFVVTEIAGRQFIVDIAADQFEPTGEDQWADLGVVLLPVDIAEQNPEQFWMYVDRNAPGKSKTLMQQQSRAIGSGL
ncbi:MAG: class I SAM-dependent methyltransferase [Candidatus Omnitrophica bacterium]|nr:class I SAM-dependent methyltransferase [Candidatus Omnitrophota bacterium]